MNAPERVGATPAESTALTVQARASLALGAADGVCACGCGGRTPLAAETRPRYGLIRGKPLRFIHGHSRRGSAHPLWKGGVVIKGGYASRLVPGHARADKAGYVFEHVLIAEQVLGKPLPEHAVVHHTDERRGELDPHGLVICQDENYHRLIHQRTRAFNACGNASWRKCTICKAYDEPGNLYLHGKVAYHLTCKSRWHKERLERLKLLEREAV